MKKYYSTSSPLLAVLLLTGCGGFGSFSNDFEIVQSEALPSSIEPTGQTVILPETTSDSTPESRYDSLCSTWEGFILLCGWEEAKDCGYDVSTLTKEEKNNAITKGLENLAFLFKENVFNDSHIPTALAGYYYYQKNDYKKALYWAFSGAEKGSSDCMLILSNAYRGGNGVVQDFEEGFKWTYLGAATGDEWCKKWIKKSNEACLNNPYASEHHSPMVKEAKKRANQWMQEHPEVFISSE